MGSDGIGDSPYVIDAYNLDRYPLMMWPPPLIVLSLYPPTNTVEVGETFSVNITVTGIVISETPPVSNGLIGWEVWMTFNPEVLHAINATESSFLRDAASTYGYTTFFAKEIDNTEGSVEVGETVWPKMPPDDPYPPEGATGDGTLATITFEVMAEGETDVHFETPTDVAKTNLYTVVANNVIKIRDDFPVFIADGLVNVPKSPLVPADLDIVPKTLNLRSKGKWITAHIELSEDYNISDIDRTTIVLNDTVPVDPFWMDKPLKSVIGDHDDDGVADLMVKFDRQAVIEYLKTKVITDAEVTLAITGETNGASFEVTDTIKVIGQ